MAKKKPEHSKTKAKKKREEAARKRSRERAVEKAKDDKQKAMKEAHDDRKSRAASRAYAKGAARADALTHQLENPKNLSKSGPSIFGKKPGSRIKF